MTRIHRLLAVAALVAVAVAACGGGSPAMPPINPSVDATTATAIARSAFQGYNDDDYSAWTRDWSDTMKAAIKASDFGAIRADLYGRMGRFVSLGTPVLGSRHPGFFNWKFPVVFEKGSAQVLFGFADGGTLIEGVSIE